MKTKVLSTLAMLFLIIFIFCSTTAIAAVPTVVTNDATDVTTSSAKLHGDLTDNGGKNIGFEWFEYGATIGYGSETTHVMVFAAGGFGLFEDTISELEQGTTYHFRACAENMDGTSYGSGKTFITLGGNNKPNITCVYPANESTNVRRKPQCYVCVNDSDMDNLSVSFYYNESGNWIFDYNETNVSSNCTVYWNFTEADEHETLYEWGVIVNDSINETTGNYSFTTNKKPPADKSYSKHPPEFINQDEGDDSVGYIPPAEGTPGFEIIILLAAMAMFFSIYGKKKSL